MVVLHEIIVLYTDMLLIFRVKYLYLLCCCLNESVLHIISNSYRFSAKFTCSDFLAVFAE